jgi:hypothetical protein
MPSGESISAGNDYMTFIIHVIGLFILVAASEMLNGIARTIFLNKRVGVRNAKRISLLPALALCLLICYYYVPFLHIRTDGGLLLLGVSLSLFMGMFDIVVARFIVKARWETILDDFNIVKGNLLGLGMVAMAFCPLLAARIGRF